MIEKCIFLIYIATANGRFDSSFFRLSFLFCFCHLGTSLPDVLLPKPPGFVGSRGRGAERAIPQSLGELWLWGSLGSLSLEQLLCFSCPLNDLCFMSPLSPVRALWSKPLQFLSKQREYPRWELWAAQGLWQHHNSLPSLHSCIYSPHHHPGMVQHLLLFLQGILQALEFLLRRNYRPRRSFYVGIGHDEEVLPSLPLEQQPACIVPVANKAYF